ncbi:hypothetical protein membrane protein [Acetobacterium woodii DSM 1030]|uniref:Uncharacterized protein n=2 Tax=Acetobacterium woodii TaxID=33952 RepID=H6LJ38_ACEWD|nr:hypothetical protein membrane protein [Acetobacterium woodii DSM 1030]
MRNIKTALAVFICIIVFAIMGPEFNPLFAAIAALITMGPSIEDSVESGWNRILGTIYGGIGGMLGIFIANLISFQYTYIAIIPIGLIVIIYFCNNFKKTGAISIACVVFISIMTTYPLEMGSYMLAILRLLETSFGIIVAFLINRFIKVPKCDEKIADSLVAKEENEKLAKTDENSSREYKKLKVVSILYMIFKP